VDGSGRRPESRRPAPSLSSGATAEYDRSRQSTDPLACPARRQALSGQARQASGRLPASSSIVAGAPAMTDSDRADRSPRSSTHRAAGATSEEAAPSGPMDRGHDTNRKGPYRTAPSERPRPKPGAIATEPPRAGVASHRRPCRIPQLPAPKSHIREARHAREPEASSLSQTTRR
jgi:hypothetical protein